MAYVAGLALIACIASHFVLVISLALRAWWKAPLALFVPPLAVMWGWEEAMRWRVRAWLLAVVVYAVIVAFAA